jgi:putative transcriptional regulator
MKNNIKVERAILSMTQEELANKVAVSRQTINAMESGKYVPSTILALKIARVFSKPVEDVFCAGEDGLRKWFPADFAEIHLQYLREIHIIFSAPFLSVQHLLLNC